MCSLEKKKIEKSFNKLGIGQTDLESNKTAVVLVDMQSPFTDRLSAKTYKSLVKAQIRILRKCAKIDIPVVVLEYKNFKDTIKEISDELKLIPRVRFILKRSPDGFRATSLNEILANLKVESLLFMGIYASRCVLSTASTAVDFGYGIFTSKDLVAEYPDDPINTLTREWLLQKGHIHKNGSMFSFL